MTRLFERRVEVVVHDLRVKSDVWQQGQRIPGLRIQFDIEQSIESTANKAKIKIYNLNAESRSRIDQKNVQFIVEAGYKDTMSTIFNGEAVHALSERLPVGWMTEVMATDGMQAQRGFVNASLAPGAGIGQVIQKVASAMGVSAKKAITRALSGDFDGAIGTYFNGVTLSGTSKEVMDRLARSIGFDWTILDGELEIILPNETIGQAVVLGPRTGLVDSPKQVYDKKKKKLVTNAKSVLQPHLRVGGQLVLESSQISGSFKITKVKHTGDTHGAEFFSECEALALA